MPRNNNNVSKHKRNRRRRATHRRRPNNNRNRSGQSMAVHRRLVLFPKVDSSNWLQQLSWFASVALKLFSLVTGIADDLKTTSSNIGSGTTVILGPGDFAALSPVAVPISTTKTDKEVVCLRAFPFERARLSRVHINIVPSVDMGERGGMYAACIIPIDPIDSVVVGEAEASKVLERYSCSYDDIIKNPRAKMAPVNRSLSLSISLNVRPSNIRIRWNDNTGFVNTYPCCALTVAFSDLAAKKGEVDSNYAPNRALFEVHMTGQLHFMEPGELTVAHDTTESSMSCYTPKLCTTNTGNINVRFFDRQFETTDGIVDLKKIDRSDAVRMLRHYDRMELINMLDATDSPVSDFEKLEM